MNNQHLQCPFCIEGSGKLIGHKGPHVIFTEEEHKERHNRVSEKHDHSSTDL